MRIEHDEAELAYTYAWWLTGDDHAARVAVLAAVDRPDVPGADDDLRLEILLRRVRAAAVQTPTMCPASELALLHDAIGLGLDSAAGLAAVDAREARTELAHGRLEALGPGVEFEVVEPHRLGGLAVGNPADVAAARQNPQLGTLREMIMRGRDELVDVSRMAVPADLLESIEARRTEGPIASTTVEHEWFEPPEAEEEPEQAEPEQEEPEQAEAEPHGLDAGGQAHLLGSPDIEEITAEDVAAERARRRAARRALDDAEEIDLSDQVADLEPASGSAVVRERGWWVLLAAGTVIGLVVLVLYQVGGAPEDAPAVGPSELAAGDDAPAGPTEVAAQDDPAEPAGAADDPQADPADDPAVGDPAVEDPAAEDPAPPAGDAAFAVQRAGVAVGVGGDPDFDNPTASPFDPVSVVVEYAGAVEGDALIAEWTVDGQPFDTERADLSPLLDVSRFTKQVPVEGWPVGQHVLALTLERTGEIVAEARFAVQPEA